MILKLVDLIEQFKPPRMVIARRDKTTCEIIDTFPSYRVASALTGVPYQSIWNCCNHWSRTAYGYRWSIEYEEVK